MQYSIFKAPFYSFFSKEFYVKTAREGKGTGFLYLFVVVLVGVILSTASGSWHLNESLNNPELDEIIKQLPDLSIKSGVMSINKPSPYRVPFHHLVTKEKKLLIFDTSGQITTTDEASALFTEKGFLMEGQKETLPWSTLGRDVEFKALELKSFFKTVSLWFFLFGVLLTPIAWFWHVVLALVYGAVGMIMDRQKLGFKTALRMASVAMTPTIVLTTLFYLFFCKPELWELITVPVSLGYLFFGYSAVSNSSEQ